jgi:hypothetical protein
MCHCFNPSLAAPQNCIADQLSTFQRQALKIKPWLAADPRHPQRGHLGRLTEASELGHGVPGCDAPGERADPLPWGERRRDIRSPKGAPSQVCPSWGRRRCRGRGWWDPEQPNPQIKNLFFCWKLRARLTITCCASLCSNDGQFSA